MHASLISLLLLLPLSLASPSSDSLPAPRPIPPSGAKAIPASHLTSTEPHILTDSKSRKPVGNLPKSKSKPKAKARGGKKSKSKKHIKAGLKQAITIPLRNRAPVGSTGNISQNKMFALRQRVHTLKAKTLHSLALYQSTHSNHPLASHGAMQFNAHQLHEALDLGAGIRHLVQELGANLKGLVQHAVEAGLEHQVEKLQPGGEGEGKLVGPDYPTWKKREVDEQVEAIFDLGERDEEVNETAARRHLQRRARFPHSLPALKRGLDPEDLRALWTGTLSIGNPPQKFELNFDTGSADFWVIAAECKATGCSGKSHYAKTVSKSEKKVNGELEVLYGDGTTASGPIFQDVVRVGTASTRAYFGTMTKATDSFREDASDGIVGMSYGSLSTMARPTLFESLWKSKSLPANIFAFRLSSASTGSFLTFGGVDKKLFKGKITWSKILDPSFWTVRGSVNVGGAKILDAKMMIDTGTSLILAPPEDAKAFYGKIQGAKPCPANTCGEAGFWTIPCSAASTVSFTFSGKSFNVAQEDFSAGRLGADTCVGALIGQDYGMSAWIVGDTFLKSVYAVFDMANDRVGFADPA